MVDFFVSKVRQLGLEQEFYDLEAGGLPECPNHVIPADIVSVDSATGGGA